MIIEEKDFRIEHDGDCFVLYLLKSKKELKENSKDSYKIHGYYVIFKDAIKAAILWRKSKKYPFKEPVNELVRAYLGYQKSIEEFHSYCNIIYEPIYKLKEKIFNEHREFQSRH